MLSAGWALSVCVFVMKRNHFPEAEGLRAYMALWVAVGHALQFAGFTPTNAPLRILMNGDAAVSVFIMLSGFVITNLLMTKQEPYPAYIARRFLRLMPAFLVTCVIGYFLAGWLFEYTANVPWRAEPYTLDMTRNRWTRLVEVRDNLLPHVAAHLTLLHGAIPQNLLPAADRTFIAPGWSISLEWQFYLLAPLILWSVRRPWALAVVAAAALVAFKLFERGALGVFETHSIIAGASGMFAVGIGSRLLLDRLHGLRFDGVGWAAAVSAVLVMYSSQALPLVIWTVFITYLGAQRTGVDAKVVNWVLANPVSRWLGNISYSLYLTHVLSMVALGYAALRLAPDLSKPMALAVQMAAILISIPISWAMYRLVELPGNALGRKLAKALGGKGRPAPAAEGGIEG